MLLFLWEVKHITKWTISMRYNSNLLDRIRIILDSSYKGMSNLMVSNNLLFLLAKNSFLLLLTCYNCIKSTKKVLLGNNISSILNCRNSCFINDISKVWTYKTACCHCNLIKINCIVHKHILRMYLKSLNSSLLIRSVNGNSSVETTWSK